MISRANTRPIVFVPLTLCVLSACAQGTTYGVSNSTILSTVIRAGEAIGASTSSRGGSSSGSATRRMPRSPAPSAAASRVLHVANQYVGVPYVWGGNTPSSGFDCSGFTRYVFGSQGVQLPRTAHEQAHSGQAVRVDFASMLPGDILLFAEPNEGISHVAIYVGSGQIIHASSAAGAVSYLDLATSRGDWYVQNLVAVRRLVSGARDLW